MKRACQFRFPPGGGASLRARPGHQGCSPGLELAVQPQASSAPSLEKHQLLALSRGRVARRETQGSSERAAGSAAEVHRGLRAPASLGTARMAIQPQPGDARGAGPPWARQQDFSEPEML